MNRLRRIDEIFCAALDLQTDERADYLRQECGDDEDLREAVEALLIGADAPMDEVDDVFAKLRDTYWNAVVGEEAVEDLSGQKIGIWQLSRVAGRGGLATVYAADRDDGQFHQRAALKVMRRGLDTDDLVLRFHSEREILASLQHPAIAAILDGGALADGRPYFVMEYVDGKSITDYATSKNLDLQARVRLVLQVVEAVHYAHQNLIVHRDIKPSNVMVDENGVVRVLDFGIAKILDPAQTPLANQLTRTGIKMMTPAYASPEQERGEHITTHTDVYQLGLLLAELLTGDRPLRSDHGSATPDFSRLKERDLVAIVQKSTRFEPEGRYASASDLAADLNRFLQSLPVIARPDSYGYRFGKYMRRRPWVVPAAGIVVLAVVAYVATITMYSQEVEKEREIAEQTKDFLIGLFQSPNPYAPADPERGRRITVLEALAIGSEREFAELDNQPELESALSRSLSEVYAALDQYELAIEFRNRALVLESEAYGDNSDAALASMRVIAGLQRQAGDVRAAAELVDKQLEIVANRPEPGIQLGLAHREAGTQAAAEGAEEDAIGHLGEAIDELVEKGGIELQLDSGAIQSVLQTATQEGTAAAVVQAEKLALSILGNDTAEGMQARARTANSLKRLGEYDSAETRFLELIPELIAQYGDRHPRTLSARGDLAHLYLTAKQFPKAESVYSQLIPLNVETFGLSSHAVAVNYQNLGTALARQNKAEDALAMFERVQDLFADVHGEEHYLNALPRISSAYLYLQSADARALPLALQASEILAQAQPGTYMLGIAQCLAGKAWLQQGNQEAGADLLTSAQPLLADDRVAEIYATLCRENNS